MVNIEKMYLLPFSLHQSTTKNEMQKPIFLPGIFCNLKESDHFPLKLQNLKSKQPNWSVSLHLVFGHRLM